MKGVTSRQGYGSDENSGADDTFTDTFGYFASAAAWSTVSPAFPALSRADEMPIWSMINVSCGCRWAIWLNSGSWPPVKNITGMPFFSAAGQNQSAVPSVSHL